MNSKGRQRKGRPGQTLIYICLILVFILFMGIFLVDLQHFVRLRARSQNGVDAAALTGAMWQGKGLNMLGELNLVRASTLMLEGLDAQDPFATEKINAMDGTIGNIQTRITYICPLLGYAAAQQAAKNNGLGVSQGLTSSLKSHIDTTLMPEGESSLYGRLGRRKGYSWQDPYREILSDITRQGLATKTLNTRYIYEPGLHGEGSWLLGNPDFYKAVANYDFCWFVRRDIGRGQPIDLETIDLHRQSNFTGSEFLNLFTGFRKVRDEDGDGDRDENDYSQLTDPAESYLDERRLTEIPEWVGDGVDKDGDVILIRRYYRRLDLRWAIYDNRRNGWNSGGSSRRYIELNKVLRGEGFRPEYIYGGACAYMFCESQPSLLSGQWSWKHGDQETAKNRKLGDALSWGDGDADGLSGSMARAGNRLAAAEGRLKHIQDTRAVNTSAAAKPFGRLGESSPSSVSLVLPVFSNVRLIPCAAAPESTIERNYEFYRFTLEYFGHADYPDVPQEFRDAYIDYISAIEAYNDPTSRFNEAWEDAERWGPDLVEDTEDDGEVLCPPIPQGRDDGTPPNGLKIFH